MRVNGAQVFLAALWVFILGGGVAWAGEPVAVPEPGSLALLVAGLGGAAWVKFRRRK
jgi:hypothetical protein